MAKAGRNAPCPCDSGLKYKKCCGDPLKMRDFKETHEYLKAKELLREQQQGSGRPIISTIFQGQRFVAVGNGVYHSAQWKTFCDFLGDYMKHVLGEDWGNNELKKSSEQRHPILHWYQQYCLHQQKYLKNFGEIQSMPTTSALSCYLGLAYSLYLIKHNVELQERLVARLKDINNFQGAYYELIVANCLIRAGFELELEDETDESMKHCEFSAISKLTKKKYWIEAKSRAVAGVLGKTKVDGTTSKDPTNMLTKHIKLAFEKPAPDERLIFIDINTPYQEDPQFWCDKAEKRLKDKERNLQPNQSAYLFMTNTPFHLDLNSETYRSGVLAYGLGINDFAKTGHFRLSEMYRRKQKHIDAHNIMQSFAAYPKIPSTFNGILPSEEFAPTDQSIKIGETYFFEDIGDEGLVATVTAAWVSEFERRMYFGTDAGEILTREMTDQMLQDYKDHPDLFFGVYKRVQRNTNDPYELFEWVMEQHKDLSKDVLLERMKDWAQIDRLKQLEHEDLVVEYSEAWARQLISISKSDPQQTSINQS